MPFFKWRCILTTVKIYFFSAARYVLLRFCSGFNVANTVGVVLLVLYMTLHLSNIDAIRNNNFDIEIVGKVDLNTAPNERAGNLAECQMKGFVCKLAHIGIFALNLNRCGTDWDSFCKIRCNRLAMSKSKYVQYLTGDGVTFYTPVWKTGRIMPWRCPSVRPSVRVYRTFFNMLWDINLKLGICLQLVAQHVEFEFHHNWVALT